MKKRNFAVAMLLCVTLAACGTESSQNTPVSPTPVYTQEEIDAHIQSVGNAYLTQFPSPTPTPIQYLCVNPYPQHHITCTNSLGVWIDSSDSSGTKGPNSYSPSYVTVNAYSGSYASASNGYVSNPYYPAAANTENYNGIAESGFVTAGSQPFSTFGADVDTAVYTNLRRKIFNNDSYGITKDAVRIEEMINYFDYDYAKPANGEKFGVVTDLTPCPWNSDTLLLRVGVRAEEVAINKGSNIVFLIDTSGSMNSYDKLPLVQESFKKLMNNLTADDTVSIVTYAGSYSVPLEGVKGDEHQKIESALNSLYAGGGTNGEGGIKKAYEIAEKYFIEGGNNRVILATDGDLNIGISSEEGLIDLIEDEKESGVFFSCLGFGTGNYQDSKMEALADHGNGNYSYIDCAAEADRVLTKEMWSTLYTVAKDVKFQVEFNPALVKGYRQIGYENRVMAAEDFEDDTKDGGEVGSDQCVTVLYEVVPIDSDYEIPNVTSRYGNSDAAGVNNDELLAVNIRYKEPDSNVSQLRTFPVTQDMIGTTMDDDTSWAAGVAQFGMLLRESEYAGTSTYEDIIDRLKQSPKVMNDDFRAEFIYMAEQVKDNNITLAENSNTYTTTGYVYSGPIIVK